jgi:nucleotide-binding universal stress UspA family protein
MKPPPRMPDGSSRFRRGRGPHPRAFPVLVCTDGSPSVRAAVEAAVGFPWPTTSTAIVIVARGGLPGHGWDHLARDLEAVSRAIAEQALKTVHRRWPDARAVCPAEEPVASILEQARILKARAIVVGSRGLGLVRRFFPGSVLRGVLRAAPCSVLVVKRPLRTARRFVLGIDGSPESQRAVEVLQELEPTRGHVTVVHVLEPARLPSLGLIPGPVRTKLRAVARQLEVEQQAAAQRLLEEAGKSLRKAGWVVEPTLVTGTPTERILATAKARAADVVVVGARGVGGAERLLLGSVAEGVIGHSPFSVLIAR